MVRLFSLPLLAYLIKLRLFRTYGPEHLVLSGIQSLGIDEIAWGRGHRPLILNWFRAKGQLLSGVVEGFNAKAKLRPTVFGPIMGWKSLCIMHLAPYPSQSSPIDFPRGGFYYILAGARRNSGIAHGVPGTVVVHGNTG